HGRAVLAVTAINFLDHALTPVAARQIEIDVGPAFASFTQKTFEDEMIAHRIDRSDAKAKTNHTVRRAPPALDHDLVFAAEIDDVPDNQKIAGETEFVDQAELELELLLDLFRDRFIALLSSEQHDRAQEGIHRVSGWDRVVGKVVTD